MCFDRICGWHKNKANMFLHLIAGVLILYAALMYSWQLTVLALIIAIIGHLIQYSMENRKNSRLMRSVPRLSKKKKR